MRKKSCIFATCFAYSTDRGRYVCMQIGENNNKKKIYIMLMKKMEKMLGAAFVFGAMLASCSQNTDFVGQTEEGEGQLFLTLDADAGFTKTRALSEASYENTDNYTVVVTDKDGIEKVRCMGAELSSKMPLTLSLGSYSVQAFYGKEHAYSRDKFYVFGEVKGSIKADKKETVEVVCEPTCGRIKVEFDKNMATYYNDYSVSFTGTEAVGTGCFEWKKNDTEPFYVALKEGGEVITFTISVTPKDDYVNNQQQGATKTGTFRLNRNKGYKMNISAHYTPTAVGDIEISITIDESTNDKPVDIEVPIEWT